MEIMVPKLVVDRKRDELNFYINPLLDKSLKNSYLPIDTIEPVLVLKPNFQDRKNSGSIVEDIESIGKKGCHIEGKSTFSGRMAVNQSAIQTFFPPSEINMCYALLCRSFI